MPSFKANVYSCYKPLKNEVYNACTDTTLTIMAQTVLLKYISLGQLVWSDTQQIKEIKEKDQFRLEYKSKIKVITGNSLSLNQKGKVKEVHLSKNDI